MQRPFPFDAPVAPEALIDRREELRRLHLAAADRVAVRLVAPRRFGKTSLLLAHARSLREAGWRTVHVDLYGVTSLVEVCGRLISGYRTLRDGRIGARLDAVAGRLGLQLGPGGVALSVHPTADRAVDAPLAAAGELLDLPLRLHERDGTPTLVVLDELQDLLAAGPALDGLLRAHIQYHGESATYVYAGSKPSLMRGLFADRERPLFGQAEPLDLGPLPAGEAVDDLADRFAALGEEPREALGAVVTMGAGHPQRTMLLCHLLHRELAEGAVGDVALADAVLARAVAQTAEAHQALWDELGSTRKAVLVDLVAGLAPTGTRAADRHRLPRATLQSALRALEADGQHLRTAPDGRRELVDPLFARWIALRGLVPTDPDGGT